MPGKSLGAFISVQHVVAAQVFCNYPVGPCEGVTLRSESGISLWVLRIEKEYGVHSCHFFLAARMHVEDRKEPEILFALRSA